MRRFGNELQRFLPIGTHILCGPLPQWTWMTCTTRRIVWKLRSITLEVKSWKTLQFPTCFLLHHSPWDKSTATLVLRLKQPQGDISVSRKWGLQPTTRISFAPSWNWVLLLSSDCNPCPYFNSDLGKDPKPESPPLNHSLIPDLQKLRKTMFLFFFFFF